MEDSLEIKAKPLPRQPKVNLVSWTKDPIETLMSVWELAKTKDAYMTPEEISTKLHGSDLVPPDEKFLEHCMETLEQVVRMEIPVSRFVHFVFAFEDVPISWREQMVRHQVDVAFWIQTNRLTDQSTFFDEGRYRLPASVVAAGGNAQYVFENAMRVQQEAYKILTQQHKVPAEDAREVIGVGLLHRLSATFTLKSLMHIIKDRTCWIAQETWLPIVTQMIQQLRDKVSPLFGDIAYPPCINAKREFIGCAFNHVSLDRFEGKDPLPCCPLWLTKQLPEDGQPRKNQILLQDGAAIRARAEKYQVIWGKDPWTFEEK